MGCLKPGSRGPVVAALALVCAAIATSPCGGAEEGEVTTMAFRVLERRYGPGMRADDWHVQALRPVFQGGYLQLGTYGDASVLRSECPLPGGGDLEITLTFSLERLGGDGKVTIDFGTPRDGDPGFTVVMTRRETAAVHNGRLIHEGRPTERSWHGIHTVRLVTLGENYAIHINGEELTSGRMDPPHTANEGRLRIRLTDADVRLMACEENFIVHDVQFAEWERAELLYEESFGPESLRANWVCTGARPDAMHESVTFNPMSVCVLRERFAGPIVVDCQATPVPTEDFDAGVTDAIFIWMMDQPEGDLFDYMASLKDASLRHYMPLPFYWVDFGGTNNQTTRLRKNPYRHMIRQFEGRKRLLKRDHTYDITLGQIGKTVEFWVDGKRWIQAHDPTALTEGHVGFRAYVAGLTVSDLKVWRVVEK